jgi:GNAT superfamily N-acetyltransferase
MIPGEGSSAPTQHRRAQLRAFRAEDLPALVAFWNVAFANRRNFRPITEEAFRSRVLACPAFEAEGLILAWEQVGAQTELAGLVHAFRPAPARGLYLAWPRKHEVALLYVRPASRRRGMGTRLLQAAENWLYYCPVYVASVGQPCYGGVEGPRAPFFGSSEHMAISAHETGLLRFFQRRGYQPFEPGSISMTRPLAGRPLAETPLPDAAIALGLRPVFMSHESPYTGGEPPDRLHYRLLGDNGGDPYMALGFANRADELVAHITWFPMEAQGTDGRRSRRAAITNVRVAPEARNAGLGGWLLDAALDSIQQGSWHGEPYDAVELNTHLVHFATAVGMYERRGFVADDAWVTLVKT